MSEDKRRVVDALIAAGVVGFAFESPRTFKSGIVSPVYLDNRKLLTHPSAWRTVIEALGGVVNGLGLSAPVIAGVETAGIPHSAALAYALGAPTVFVRKQAKEHGLKQRIEGGDVSGRAVVLVEDQVTTGGSSLSAVGALREAGAVVGQCLAITSYGFGEAAQAFAAAGVALHVLVTFDDLLPRLAETGVLNAGQAETVRAWLADPQGWAGGAR
ncbi:MAG: orotate phosphoribosyltransferase [Anaerolineae bacterium]|jgi:orotate phosphoribosyltransferase|nr:orotate phosphoribosyltransferase [Anaerolineae bacterium]